MIQIHQTFTSEAEAVQFHAELSRQSELYSVFPVSVQEYRKLDGSIFRYFEVSGVQWEVI